MKILCDVDGVLADFVGAMCEGIRDICEEEYNPAEFITYSLESQLSRQAYLAFDYLYHSSGFCLSIPWYPGAKDFLKSIVNTYDVLALTSPGPSDTWDSERRQWFSGRLAKERIVFCNHAFKERISGDVLIEDNKATGEAWLRENPRGHLILLDRPWNQGTMTPNATRAFTYDDVIFLLMQIEIRLSLDRDTLVT